jgi:hypothetical protein
MPPAYFLHKVMEFVIQLLAYFLHKVMEFVIQLLMKFSFLTPLLSKNSIVISEFQVQQESLSALRFCSLEPVRLGGNMIG